MYERIANIDFPTSWCKGRSLEELKARYGSHVADKFLQQLYDKLNPKQKTPKKKRNVETKVDDSND